MTRKIGIQGHRDDIDVVGQQDDNVEADTGTGRKGNSKGIKRRVNWRCSITDTLQEQIDKLKEIFKKLKDKLTKKKIKCKKMST